MAYFSGIGLKVKEYKSFSSDEYQGIDDIKHINVLIGKNNSGKSAFLEFLLEFLKRTADKIQIHDMNFQVQASRKATNEVPGDFLSALRNRGRFVCHPRIFRNEIKTNGKLIWNSGFNWAQNESSDNIQKVRTAGGVGLTLLENRSTFHIAAERDIVKEDPTPRAAITSKGAGITRFVNRLTNSGEFTERLALESLINGMNEVLSPEIFIEDIRVREVGSHNQKEVEIFLSEKDGKIEVPLSSMGSGVKTILFVMIALLHCKWKDHERGKEAKDTIFFFEELENNLHPRIFRRLLQFIRAFSHEHECPIFLSTHSPIAIDFFRSDPKAQIIHVWREGLVSKMKTIEGLSGGHTLLDDLGVHASDLLQSNCVIWVEGPSDRIYLNHWILQSSEGKLVEGIHYQCVFYGGRLASHLEVDMEESEEKELINLLRINRKVIFVGDSDKDSEDDNVNETKKRLQDEVAKAGGVFWLTSGREIENYVSKELIAKVFSMNLQEPFVQYEPIANYLNRVGATEWVTKPASGKPHLKDKIKFAKKLLEGMDAEYLNNAPWELKEMIETMVDYIRKANS